LLCLFDKVDAVHNRHQQVNDDNVRHYIGQVLQCIHSIGGSAADLTQLFLLNNDLQDIADAGIIVDEIYFHFTATSRFCFGILMLNSVHPFSEWTSMLPPNCVSTMSLTRLRPNPRLTCPVS